MIARALAIACAALALTLVGAADARAPFRPLGVWGGPGIAAGQFNTPNGIAVDDMGHVYVADELNHRVQKFSSHGRLLAVLGGTPGVGDGQFNAPYGVAVDGFGDVYVADTRNNRIQKLSATGRFLARWGRNGGDGSGGTGSGEFSSPRGIAVDDLGHVYVADHDNNRVVKLSPTGRFMARWGRNHGDGTPGSGNGEFRVPYTIALDGAGDIYVTDVLNHRIQKFGPTGRFIARYGHNGGDGTPGTALGDFEEPYGVATDCRSNVYVTEEGTARVQKLGVAGRAAPRCPPAIALSTRGAQRAVARGGLRAAVGCDRPCDATATAVITGAAAGALHARVWRGARVMRGRPAGVRLALRRTDAAVIARAVRAGHRVRARITVRATGFAGRARTVHRVVRVAR